MRLELGFVGDLIKPVPVLDNREQSLIEKLSDEYEKHLKPGLIKQALNYSKNKIGEILPDNLKNSVAEIGNNISEQEIYKQVMKVVANGFIVLQEQAAKLTISHESVIKNINKHDKNIINFDEVCFARSYNIQTVISNNTYKDYSLAFVEGGVTGFFGFAGLPFNIALSLFIYFRAVQNIALYYGYNVKDDPTELHFASEVLMMAFAPDSTKGVNTIAELIGKMMALTKTTILTESLKKRTLAEMAQRGGIELFYVQVRALAHSAAKKALDKTGEKNLEKSIFSEMLEQLGKRLPKNAAKKAVPVIGGVIGALFDTAYMHKILKFSQIVYHKRFLVEKEIRINFLIDCNNEQSE